MAKDTAKKAAEIIAKERAAAVQRISEIDAEIHQLTKEKNLLSVSIQKIDAAQK